MPAQPVERKLAAIFAADIAGYSRLMARDEVGTLGRLKACRAIIDELITSHRGRIFNTAGDSVVADFASAVDAVQCAVAVQAAITMENTGGATDEPMQFRIGVHVGDVMVDGENLLGDGVNIAARLESLAEPGTICVSAVARDQVGNRLALAFDDLGDQQVKNIPQAIRVYRVRTATQAALPGTGALALPDKPSLVVLPFQNMSGDPEQEYFADGTVEEITTAIARFPWLFVIARNSAFTYKGKAVDVRQVARELGVRYVLEGSVRKGGLRVRITGQLIDTSTGAHIWADRFDGVLDDIFDLQEGVASSVAGAIEPRLRQSEIERAVRKPTENLGAYDLYLRAVGAMYKNLVSREAMEFARRALAVQPDYAPAAAMIAAIRLNQLLARAPLTDAEIAEALDFARSAVGTRIEDPDTLARGGHALVYLGGGHAPGMRAIERALELNPSSAYAWGRAALVHCAANRPDAAIAATARARRLSPLDPFDFIHEWALGYALMLAGRYEEAMEWTDRCLHDRPSYQTAIRGRVALCGYLGRPEEAREWLKRLLDVDPALTIAEYIVFASRFHSAGTLAVWVEGFRRAGLQEA